MKVKLFILLIFVMGCQNNDIDSSENLTDTINGTWNLKNVYGGLMPIDIDYNIGEVKWTFNDANGNVIVENNIITTGPEDVYSGLDSGTYTYEIQIINNIEVLYVNNAEMGVLQLLNNNLDIDNGLASDGYITSFKR
ncbi:hypothetical protein [uncultured Lacinutrix sp.]|uniref:hypothetical protein n=1 Tax=uncultured Lacinutrix sp. TaxID=574032 RepID=UPI002609F6EC|nr:hypothetical protein [uncultured Lacinutrix sp.]